MISRIQDTDEYHNIIQLAWMLIYSELLEAMEAIKVYDNESGEWNARRIFWYLMGAIPALVFILLVAAASWKYIWN